MPTIREKIVAGVIIATAFILAVTSVWNDSFIVDEIPHVGAGYSYIAKGDMRLNPEHPPLAKDLAGIAMSFLNLNDQPAFETNFWKEDINGQWEFGRRLIYNSGNDAELLTRTAKIPMLAFFVVSAILIFHWTSRLYSPRTGLMALTLFSFSPTVMTHARFVTTDVPALFGVLFATYFFLRYLSTPNQKNFWLAAIMFGLALLTKFSTFLLAPYFVLLALVFGWIHADHQKLQYQAVGAIRYFLQTILVFIVGFMVVVWPVYYFHTWQYPPERQYRDTQNLMQSFGKRYLADPVVWASDKPVLRAAAQYGLGLLMVAQRSAGGNTTYFLGEVSRFGWRSYFPIVYLIKEPLAWWGLVILTLLFLAWETVKPHKKFWTKWRNFVKKYFVEFAMLLWLMIYWATSIQSTLNIGVRHLLPVYPFSIMLVSGRIERIIQKAKITIQNYNSKFKIFNSRWSFSILQFTIYILIGWYILENIKIYPYYLTYFNQVAGGPSQGYKYVVDSNLDWGQDLKRLSQWLDKNNIPEIELDYFGWADPLYYLGERYEYLSSTKYIDAQDFLTRNYTNGWIAVSGTFLQGSQGSPDQYKPINYVWLQSYTPIVVIGNSIFVYRITR